MHANVTVRQDIMQTVNIKKNNPRKGTRDCNYYTSLKNIL